MEYAIIMASGMGTRLRPLTEKTPKPLMDRLRLSVHPIEESGIYEIDTVEELERLNAFLDSPR